MRFGAGASSSVLALFRKLHELRDLRIENLHPAYSSLSVDFNPNHCEPAEIEALVRTFLTNVSKTEDEGRQVEVPVVYGGEDLEEVAAHLGLSIESVIREHCAHEYRVAFLGFSPGFPYLSGGPGWMIPRKKVPRVRVLEGSVAVAGHQAGIYPVASPGGWQLLGRTPLKLFNPTSPLPSLLQPGDRVRFKSIAMGSFADTSMKTSPSTSRTILEILDPGFYSTLQDTGRTGWAHLGVSIGGAADPLALRIGNLLVGSAEGATAVEMTVTGVTVRFLEDTWFSLTGAQAPATLDQIEVGMWCAIPVCAGQVLRISTLQSGLRSYLCVHGGVGAIRVLDRGGFSASGHFGGHFGRPLAKGDCLPAGSEFTSSPRHRQANQVQCRYQKASIVLRATKGPQWEWFSSTAQDAFFKKEFTVTDDVNRLGVRIKGSPLERIAAKVGQELESEGIANASVQVATGGDPMILFCDQTTTGGYPKIATVARVDWWKLGQLAPGAKIRFEEVSLDKAWRLCREEERTLQTAVVDR